MGLDRLFGDAQVATDLLVGRSVGQQTQHVGLALREHVRTRRCDNRAHEPRGCRYRPEKNQLLAIRRRLLEHHVEWKKLIEDKKLLRVFSVHDPMALTRPPKGFPAEHPAMEWIKWRQWGVTTHLPADVALKPGLAEEIEKRFRLAAPMVDFLNAPFVRAERRRPVWTGGRLHA